MNELRILRSSLHDKIYYVCLPSKKSKDNVNLVVSFFFSRNYRFIAYQQYTAWSHYFEVLGKGVRVVIPSCVVQEIRKKFPNPPGVPYVGFAAYQDIID